MAADGLDLEPAWIEVKHAVLDGGVGLAGAPEMIRGTVESLRPALIGESPLRTERIWAALWSPKLLGRRGFTTRPPRGNSVPALALAVRP